MHEWRSVTLSVQKLTFLPIPKRDHRSVMSGRTTFMTRDSWWLAISIVWLFVLLGALLLSAFALVVAAGSNADIAMQRHADVIEPGGNFFVAALIYW